MALRTLTVFLLLILLLEPAKTERLIRRVRSSVAILVDVSESMRVPDGDTTRWKVARRWLSDPLSGWLETHRIERYTFGIRLDHVPEQMDVGKLEPNAPATHVLEALSALAEKTSGSDLAGVILVSDGVDNGALRWLQEGQDALTSEVAQVLDRLEAPIYFAPVGRSKGLADLRVVDVRGPSFTFVMNAASLDVEIEVQGRLPPQIEVNLFEDGRPSRTERIKTRPKTYKYRHTIPFLPRTVGERVYTIRVSGLANESYTENNEHSLLIPCIRDRIRVLQVAGHPSYDQRFVREHLKSNPNVDLVSFFILVDAEDDIRYPAHETSLIPFPVRELFEDELPGFDLVIFQDFLYRPVGAGAHLERIRDFVTNGGALLVFGGGRSYERGQYQNTLLETLLPVRLEGLRPTEEPAYTEPFRPTMTESGRHHPILRLLPDASENEQLLTELPLLEGVNRVTGLRDGAITLLEHPDLKSDEGTPLPIVSLLEVGEGRTVAITTASLWRWNFVHAGKGGDSHAYNRFLASTIGWLLKDPEMSPLRLSLEPQVPREHEQVEVRLSLADPSFRPASDHPYTLSLHLLSDPTAADSELRVPLESAQFDSKRCQPTRCEAGVKRVGKEALCGMLQCTSGADGKDAFTITAPDPGVYRLVLSSRFKDRTLSVERRIVVDPGSHERSRIFDSEKLVEKLTEKSGGRRISIRDTPDSIGLSAPVIELPERSRERPLWSHAGVLLLAVLLLGVEWAIRKRSGLP